MSFNNHDINRNEIFHPKKDISDDYKYESWDDGEGEPCPICGKIYRLILFYDYYLYFFKSTGEFWIACDYCDLWYCGSCSKVINM